MKGGNDESDGAASVWGAVAEATATGRRVLSQRSRSGAMDRGHGLQRTRRPCARCGVVFQRTPVRWVTCLHCYLVNSKVDPIESRASLASSWRRAEHVGQAG